VSQITLVPDEHDDDVGIGVVTEFLQPAVDVIVGLVFADIVHEKGTDGAVSQICALIVLESTWIERVANSTPMVDLESRLNSFRVNRLRRLDLPTPESPISTTIQTVIAD
jgi:hypothetical protein